MTTKQDLHRLIDKLPDRAMPEAERLLETLTIDEDPVWKAAMEAPEDDEPLTAEDIAAIEEGNTDIARGDVVPWEEVKARFWPNG